MNLDAWHALSLRRTLLLVLFPGLMLVLGAELWSTWRTAVDAANAAYDRSLLGAIKAMDANISTASGGLGVELPYQMVRFFSSSPPAGACSTASLPRTGWSRSATPTCRSRDSHC